MPPGTRSARASPAHRALLALPRSPPPRSRPACRERCGSRPTRAAIHTWRRPPPRRPRAPAPDGSTAREAQLAAENRRTRRSSVSAAGLVGDRAQDEDTPPRHQTQRPWEYRQMWSASAAQGPRSEMFALGRLGASPSPQLLLALMATTRSTEHRVGGQRELLPVPAPTSITRSAQAGKKLVAVAYSAGSWRPRSATTAVRIPDGGLLAMAPGSIAASTSPRRHRVRSHGRRGCVRGPRRAREGGSSTTEPHPA